MENAEVMAVNGLFKKLKVNLEEIKGMLNEINEVQTLKAEYF